MIGGYDFPEISYFVQGNAFTGSEGDNFRYRISKEDDSLKASVWYEDLCYECCNVECEEKFGVSDEELIKAIEWIYSKRK